MALKTYTLTIEYDEDTEEGEYIQEYIDEEEFECLVEFESSGCIDMSEYWDKETMELIDEIYDVGVS